MNTRRDPDRLIHLFLMDGATELADEVYVSVRDQIDHTRQRAVIGPWREPDVNRYLKIALAVAAVVVVAVVGFRQFGGANVASPGSSETPAPTVTPSPTPTSAPSSSDAGGAPPLTETFASERDGTTMSYPSGWATRPATEPWTTGVPDFGQTIGDVVYDPDHEGDLWIAAASQSIGDATPDAWVADKLAFDDGCKTTVPITVDGATGAIGANGCTRAAVTSDGRGYFFWLYTGGNDASLTDSYDTAWFKEFLAAVQLPVGSGSVPTSTEAFASDRHGIAISYPSGWETRPATESWTTSVPDFLSKAGDVMFDGTRPGNLWIVVASQPIGDATPEAWATETIAMDDGCTASAPITVDGATGLIGDEGCERVAVTTDGRGYFIWLYTSGDEPSLSATYDRAWFEELLSTVKLEPGAAVD